jgi:hypothetical protein
MRNREMGDVVRERKRYSTASAHNNMTRRLSGAAKSDTGNAPRATSKMVVTNAIVAITRATFLIVLSSTVATIRLIGVKINKICEFCNTATYVEGGA